MKEPFDEKDNIMELIGLGRFSSHKSYYPELQKKIKELEEEKERYKSLFESVISGILRFDATGKLLDANPFACKILESENPETISCGKIYIQQYIGEKNFVHLTKMIEKNGSLMGFEMEITTVSTKKWLRMNASCSGGENSDKTFDLVMEDTTKNHKFRAQLEISEKRTRTLFENSPISMSVYDLKGNLLKYNDSFARLVGIYGSEAAEIKKYNIFSDKSFLENGVLDQVKKVLSGESAEVIECPYQIPEELGNNNGKADPVWVKVNCYGDRDNEGKVTNFFLMQENVSKRKKAEKELMELNQSLEIRVKKRTEELERINNELKDFAYIVSHDLKAPLRGISQISAWLEEDYSEKIDEAGKQLLELMADRTKRMEAMIEGILEYSRAGRKIKEFEEIDLNEMLSEIFQFFPEIDEYTVFKEELPVINAERLKIEQIFQNLVSNTVKYMDKKLPRIDILYRKKKDCFCIIFCDNGCGIEKKYHEKVFEIFQTLDISDKKRGTGIGLAVVKKIVENYGGSVELDSKAGSGTCIKLSFPLEFLKKNA